jgi:hypothetical protein
VEEGKTQLEKNILSWDNHHNRHPHGVAATGRETRFFELPARTEELEDFVGDPRTPKRK